MEIKRLAVGELEANCYILSSGAEICVIDPGEDGEAVVKEIKKSSGLLKYIINTHHHYDHAKDNELVREKCGGKILIHKKEEPYIDFHVDRFLWEGEEILFGTEKLRVMHTPGHSKGSICLLHDTCIFTGDTVFLNGHGRVDLVGGSMRELEESLRRLSDIVVPGMTVYPGHGDSFRENK